MRARPAAARRSWPRQAGLRRAARALVRRRLRPARPRGAARPARARPRLARPARRRGACSTAPGAPRPTRRARQVWTLVCLELWAQTYVDRPGERVAAPLGRRWSARSTGRAREPGDPDRALPARRLRRRRAAGGGLGAAARRPPPGHGGDAARSAGRSRAQRARATAYDVVRLPVSPLPLVRTALDLDGDRARRRGARAAARPAAVLPDLRQRPRRRARPAPARHPGGGVGARRGRVPAPRRRRGRADLARGSGARRAACWCRARRIASSCSSELEPRAPRRRARRSRPSSRWCRTASSCPRPRSRRGGRVLDGRPADPGQGHGRGDRRGGRDAGPAHHRRRGPGARAARGAGPRATASTPASRATSARERLERLYREASCVVLAARRGEGLPNVLLEAMARGRRGGRDRRSPACASWCVTASTACWCRRATRCALRDALARLAHERGLAERLGAAGRDTAEALRLARACEPRLEALLSRWSGRERVSRAAAHLLLRALPYPLFTGGRSSSRAAPRCSRWLLARGARAPGLRGRNRDLRLRPAAARGRADGITVLRAYPPASRAPGRALLPPAALARVRALAAADADVYYARGAGLRAGVAYDVARLAGRGASCFVAAHDPTRGARCRCCTNPRDRWWYRRALRGAAAVIAQTESSSAPLFAVRVRRRQRGDAQPGRDPGARRSTRAHDGSGVWLATYKPAKRPEWFTELARRLPDAPLRHVRRRSRRRPTRARRGRRRSAAGRGSAEPRGARLRRPRPARRAVRRRRAVRPHLAGRGIPQHRAGGLGQRRADGDRRRPRRRDRARAARRGRHHPSSSWSRRSSGGCPTRDGAARPGRGPARTARDTTTPIAPRNGSARSSIA